MRPLLTRCFLPVALLVFAHLGFAQQSAQLSGIIDSPDPLAEGTRVAIHIVDQQGVWGDEIATVAPVAGTFSITAEPVEGQQLRSFRSGAVLLPGLQNEYQVAPSGVNFLQGRVNLYVDNDGSGVFDRITDAFYVGVSSLQEPVGFFSLIYVDQAATITSGDVSLELAPGWNIFTVRFPGDGATVYDVRQRVDDLVLTAVLPD